MLLLLLTVPVASAVAAPVSVPATSPAQAPVKASGYLEAGEAALAAQDWRLAESSFRAAIGEGGDSVAARAGIARAAVGRGDAEAAIGGIEVTVERWARGGGYAQAEELLEAGLELLPGISRLLVLLGRVRVLDRKYLAAEAPLAAVYDRGEADPRALLYYGATLWENGRLDGAEQVLRQALADSGGALPARYQLGRLLLWLGRYAEAADHLGRCAAQAPEAADVQLDLARALDAAGSSEEALEVFRRAAALAPEHSEIRYGLAMALMRTGDRDGSRVELETYGRLYQREQERTMQAGLEKARVARGRELVRLGKADEAVAYLRDLPESADSLAALAAALRASGDLQGAVDKLGRAVALEPERTDLRALLNESRLELVRRP